MCKTEMKNLDKDKTFIDLLKRMTDITNKLMEIRFKKTPVTTNDLTTVKSLNKQLQQCIKDKYKIEAFNKLHTCRFDKCQAEIEKGLDIFKMVCKEDKTKSFCPLLAGKMNLQKNLKIGDSMQIETFKNIEKDVKQKLSKKTVLKRKNKI
jgi:hypothetical protein